MRDLLPVLMQVYIVYLALDTNLAKYLQAQPNKLRIKSQNDDKLEEKMLAKASVIVSAANRLWSKSSWTRGVHVFR